MKDIDFDELDKAVNSLMGGVKTKSDRPEAKTLTLTTTLKDGEQPEYDKIQHAAEKIGNETLLGPMEKTAILSGAADDQIKVLSLSDKPLTPLTLEEVTGAPVVATQDTPAMPKATPEPAQASQSAPTKASSGRFMDVMHHSSDMKTMQGKAATTESSTKATQQAIVVPSRPATPSVVQQVSTKPEHAVEPVETPVVDAIPVSEVPQIVEQEPLVTEKQDVAVAAQEPEHVLEVPGVSEVQSDGVTAPQTIPQATQESVDQVEPLTSPFLPDAKVEKRPLGGSADTSPSDELDLGSLDTPYANDNSADTQLTPSEANQTVLPDELHNDLLAIETNLAETMEAQEKTETAPVSAPVDPPATEIIQATPPAVSSDTTDDTPENGAIFDTTDYHKTVSHPTKHTSEWIWIAVIVGIILVCAAGAAAFYLLSSQ